MLFRWLSYLYRGYSKGGADCGKLIDDLLILLLAYDSEMLLESRIDSATASKRKERSLVFKTFLFIAEGSTKADIYQAFSNYSAIFQHKNIWVPLLALTNHLITSSQSSLAPKFAYLIYSSVFEFSPTATDQPKQVISNLCKGIRATTASLSVFEKKRVIKSSQVNISILLQLSKHFAQKMSPFSDQLLGLLEEISKGTEPSLLDLTDIRKLFVILANIAFG